MGLPRESHEVRGLREMERQTDDAGKQRDTDRPDEPWPRGQLQIARSQAPQLIRDGDDVCRETSRSTCPARDSDAARAMSAWDTMPQHAPRSSTTGTRLI